ncbi:MAG: hypothetical protein JW909_13210 [Planctomycetes bacterium]|nr:hypothetical protein [Planctomycetota bacterium]
MTGNPEAANLAQIDRLNQRGGRTLSFVDLIDAGTLSPGMAGELTAIVESGSSFLTAALMGGVGKSTVLAGLLACLPPGETVVTTPDAAAVESAHAGASGSACYLAHEIGSGMWYAYLWADAAARFIALAPKARVASCLHADGIDELYAELVSQGCSESDVAAVGLLVFMRRMPAGRRVTSVYVSDGRAHRVRWRLDEAADRYEPVGDCPVDAARAGEFAELYGSLMAEGVHEFPMVRARIACMMRPAGA